MTKDKIVFFASGDFAIETFELLLENGFNVVGLVTSSDKVNFHNYHISQVAEQYGVPTYIVKNGIPMEEDDFFIDWLKRANADIFCVISFKKLPYKVIKMAKKCAFNVHASLLPFLRGAAPINWAIRMGYKETGLTAFVLNDKIDCGDIIANTKIKIAKNEKFTTLFKKLSELCVDFTTYIIDDVLQRENWKDYLIVQGTPSTEYEYLATAPKIDLNYFKCHWTKFTAEQFKHCVDSVDNIGFSCKIILRDKNGKTKEIMAKIYDVEIAENDNQTIDDTLQTLSDGKTFIKITLADNTAVYVKKIQIIGKKVMDVETFLNGFRHFRENKYKVLITDLMETDNE